MEPKYIMDSFVFDPKELFEVCVQRPRQEGW